MRMNYAIRRIGDVSVLDLSGHISPGKTIADRRVLHDLVSEQVNSGCQKILLNLREVTYIDSSGFGDLLEAQTVVQNHGGQLRICNAGNRVGDLLNRMHLDAVLLIDADEPTALQIFLEDTQKNTSVA
jgi:anti-sigma B factor antagonist